MFYDYLDSGIIGVLTLAGDDDGLRRIMFPSDHDDSQHSERWTHRPGAFESAKAQLRAYFKGERKQFDLLLAPVGTPFQLQVWQALRTIPYGQLVSYKTIATAIGNPRAVRAVGGANSKNPLPIVIPCHRVIGSDGTLTGFRGGIAIKQKLIDLERNFLSLSLVPVRGAGRKTG